MIQAAGPNFLVVGGQKCGSTSLERYLRQHPSVGMAQPKELRFFSGEADPEVPSAAIASEEIRDIGEYQRYFHGCRHKPLRGEASPSYLFYPWAASRIRAAYPEIKIVGILRNPRDRAISEYWHHWRMGRKVGFSRRRFFASEPINDQPDVADYRDCIRRGIYAPQVRAYTEVFPVGQLLWLRFEDLMVDAQATMNRVFMFLGLPAVVLSDTTAFNEGVRPGRLSKLWLDFMALLLVEARLTDEVTKTRKRQRLRRRAYAKVAGNARIFSAEALAAFEADRVELEAMLGWDLETWRYGD